MKWVLTTCLSTAFFAVLSSCGERVQEIKVTEKRGTLPKYDYEQFVMEVPAHWRRSPDVVPGKQFRKRLLSYQFGDKGAEIYVTYDVGGGLLPNANRWLGMVSNEPIENLDSLELIDIGERQVHLIEAYGEGKDRSGVTSGERRGFLGIYHTYRYIGTYTLTMTGPENEVKAEKENFIKACRTLRYVKEAQDE